MAIKGTYSLDFLFGEHEALPKSFGASQDQGDACIARLEMVFPGLRDAATGSFVQSTRTQNRFFTRSYSSFKPGQLTAFARFFYVESDDPDERQDVHVGNLVLAGEHLSDAFYGYMNGAAQAGRLAAEVVVRSLRETPSTSQIT